MKRSALLSCLLLVAVACEDPPKPPDPKQQAEGLYVVATAHYLQGDFATALKLLDESKALMPDNPKLPAMYGEVFLSQGKLKEALAEFENALKVDPKRATTWSRIGYIHSQLGDREAARSATRKALALNPSDFNALESLGELDLKEDNFDDAVKNLVAAAEAAPNLNKPKLYLRAVDALLKKDRRPEAALLLKTAVGKTPSLPGEVWSRLGELLVLEGDVKNALVAYEAAAKRLPKDPIPWEIVGEIYRSMDKPADAEAAWRESLRVEDRAVVHVQIARLKLARNELDSAQAELDLALKAAKGEEKREPLEIAELLIEMKRKPDALKLLAHIASEEDNRSDTELQLKTARLAKELKDAAVLEATCARAVDAGVKKCP